LALIAPLGSLMEILVAVASAAILAQLLVRSRVLVPPTTPDAKRPAIGVIGPR
jgi:hypothetical protein